MVLGRPERRPEPTRGALRGQPAKPGQAVAQRAVAQNPVQKRAARMAPVPLALPRDAARQARREQSDAAPPVLESPQTAAQAAPREAVPPMDATESAPP